MSSGLSIDSPIVCKAMALRDSDAAAEVSAQRRRVGVDCELGQLRDVELSTECQHRLAASTRRLGCRSRHDSTCVPQLEQCGVPGHGVGDGPYGQLERVPACAVVEDVEQGTLTGGRFTGDHIEGARLEVEYLTASVPAVEGNS